MHRRTLRDNGLSIALATLFVVFWVGQAFTGYREFNEDQEAHGDAPVSLGSYLRSSHFWEATSENWESEFLQIFSYVFLTAILFQRGSAESKKPDEPEPVDRDPHAARIGPETPMAGSSAWLRSSSCMSTRSPSRFCCSS